MTTTMRKLAAAAFLAAVPLAGGCASVRGGGDCDGGSCASGHGGGGGYGLRGNKDAPFQDRYSACIDPCWPERYSIQARELTLAPFAAHAANGQALDQTLFNGDFEAGTAKLHPGGMAKLDTITRRRPVDGRVFIQTARDATYDAAKSAEFVKTKADLDAKRTQAVRDYLNASTAGRNLQFELAVTDPADTNLSVVGPASSTRGHPTRFGSGIGGLIQVNQGTAGGANATANVTGAAGGTAGTNSGIPGTGAPGAPGSGGGTGGGSSGGGGTGR